MGLLDMETCYDGSVLIMSDLHMMSHEPTLMSEVFCERPKQKAIVEWRQKKAQTTRSKRTLDTTPSQRQRAATQPMPRKNPDVLHKSSSDRPLHAQFVIEPSSLRHVVSGGSNVLSPSPSGRGLGKPVVELSLDSNQVMLEDLCSLSEGTDSISSNDDDDEENQEEMVVEMDESEDQGSYEWGWFEDFDEPEEEPAFHDYVYSNPPLKSPQGGMKMASSACSTASTSSNQVRRTHACAHTISNDTNSLYKQRVPTSQELCKTFLPLRLGIETEYAKSPYQWMRSFSSTSHLAAKIQIRSFRIVENGMNRSTLSRHAEYFVELQLNGYYFTRWIRFSALRKFLKSLDRDIFHQTHASWKRVESITRWFDRLEVDYLHRRCKLLEVFAQTLLYESTTAHTLAELMEA